MDDFSQYSFIKDLPQYKQQFITLKEIKICDWIVLISKWPFVLCTF